MESIKPLRTRAQRSRPLVPPFHKTQSGREFAPLLHRGRSVQKTEAVRLRLATGARRTRSSGAASQASRILCWSYSITAMKAFNP